MPRTISSRDLRKAEELSRQLHNDPEPIYVTKGGVDDMVIMSVETYESLVSKVKMLQVVLLAEQQEKKGHMQSAQELFQELSRKYGL